MDFKGIELVVFDLDYTLIDSSDGIVYCFNRARRMAGESEVEPARIKENIGLPIDNTFKVLGSRDPHAMRVVFRKLAREGAMAERSFLLPRVAETLSELAGRGYRMAVNSTKSSAEIISVIERLDIAKYFEASVGSDEVMKAKPAPDSLLLVMEKTGFAAGKTLYVGDHVVDVQAARAAGVCVVAVEGGPVDRGELEREGPDALIENLAGLLDLL